MKIMWDLKTHIFLNKSLGFLIIHKSFTDKRAVVIAEN